MHAGMQRRARTALVASLIGLVVVAPGAATGSPEPPKPAPFPKGIGPVFRKALSQPQGPVIEGTTLDMSAAVTTGDPVKGTYGPQVSWPLVPIHAAIAPDGRVLTYGSDRQGQQTGYYDFDLWDPSRGTGPDSHRTLPNGSATDLFCNTQTLLLNGDIEMYGGDNLPISTQTFNNSVTQFRAASDTVVKTGKMYYRRWYASSTMLPNGEVYVQGGSGGKDYPEVRQANGTFRTLTGARTGQINSTPVIPALVTGYPHNYVAPDGLIFGLAGREMYKVNPSGTGSIIRQLAQMPSDNIGPTSTAAMFAPGKILQIGGFNGRQTSIININGQTPQITAAPLMKRSRKWANATMLPDGRVFVSGGSKYNNEDKPEYSDDVAYTAEIYNPQTNTWSDGPTARRMRLYHSTSLLMPDGTVLTMGGGVPGPETNLNAEIYYPSYLFADNGSLAPRPTITAATTAADPGTGIVINTPDAASVSRVTFVKLGSVTHSVDMDQRFMNLAFSVVGDTVEADLPANPYLTPPGYYMVFIFDGDGVPSEARVVKIGVANGLH